MDRQTKNFTVGQQRIKIRRHMFEHHGEQLTPRVYQEIRKMDADELQQLAVSNPTGKR